MIPAEAVVDTGQLQYVFVVTGEGHYEPRAVRGTARGDDLFEVLDGVREGEVVVTTAGFLIDSESRLRAAIQNRAARARPDAAGAAGAAGAVGSPPGSAPAAPPAGRAASPQQPAPAPVAPGHVH
jgi:Cu(I)/Ag(I) efflux system membrane fusion protein